MSFGNYTGTALPGVTQVTVNCLVLTGYNVGLNAGTGTGATVTTRKMTGPGGATLSYKMFQNSARTTNWGNTPGIDTVSGIGSSFPQPISVYGQITAGQSIAPGTYTDTIIATTNGLFTTATATFTVTAVVPTFCTISASALNFGNYSGSLIDASSAVTVNCTNLTLFNIGLSAGTATGATVTTRRMTSPALGTLNYTLFRDGARTQNWGNTVGVDTLISQANGTAQQYGVFGRLPAGQSATVATYTDTITATITY
jgi:spore coat protein U-like protein